MNKWSPTLVLFALLVGIGLGFFAGEAQGHKRAWHELKAAIESPGI